jgi:TetR/AcrR family transcriptional repressor of nem operon
MLKRIQSAAVPETKRKLVDAGMNLMRASGYNATTVDDICAAAGVTKGGFFHYFKSKDELAQAALEAFFAGKARDYQAAPFRRLADPLERILGRLDFVEAASGTASKHVTKGCLIGVFAQEMAFTNSALREACQGYFSRMAGDFEKDLTEAKAAYAPKSNFEPKSVAWLYLAIVQGSLLLAKVAGNNSVLAVNIDQFRQYLQGVLGSGRGSAASTPARRGPPALN